MRLHAQTLSSIGSLRGRLTLWFAGLAVLTLLCSGIYVARIAIATMTEAEGAALHASATTAANALATGLREREDEIYLLSQAPHFTKGNLRDIEVLHSLERRRYVHEEYAWLGVTNANGVVLHATGGLLVGQSMETRPWFKAALKGPYTGDVHDAILLAKLLQGASDDPLRFVDFASPIINRAGQTLGVLGAHVHWRWVTDTVDAAVSGRDGLRSATILIVGRNGAILYPQHLAGGTLPSFASTVGKPHEIVRWPDGKDYLSSNVAVNANTRTDLGWRLVVRKPLELATQPVRDIQLKLTIIGLMTAVLFSFVAYRLATTVSRPIEQLAAAARQVELRSGTPDYPTGRPMREIAQLIHSIQSMTQSLLGKEHELESINSSLEATVDERTQALTRANAELERLAAQDGLTRLANRRKFDERITEAFLASRRSGRNFTLLVLDLDHFKNINDTHGHPVGDAVLRTLATLLTASVRITDFVARYGGEEFAILLTDTDGLQVSLSVAEKIRSSVAAADFPVVGNITVSIGLAASSATDEDPWQIVSRADAALYHAKAAGRNRVSASGDARPGASAHRESPDAP